MRLAPALLALLGCAAAHGGDVPSVRPSAPAPAAVPAGAPAPRWSPRDPVRVRLSGFERADAVEVRRGAGAPLRVERDGELVRLDARAPAREVRLGAEGASLELGARRIDGELAIRARRGGGLEVDALLDLESYVRGVLAGEVSLWSAPAAELEAQAIVSRSYVVRALTERSQRSAAPYVFDDTRDQVFDAGTSLAGGGEPARVAARLARALEATRGQVLREGERVVDARFSAACGGRTADARAVAPEADFECLRSVDCQVCARDYVQPLAAAARRADDVGWRARVGAAELSRALGLGGPCLALAVARDDGRGRWLEVEARDAAATQRLAVAELRARLGGALPSNWIVAARVDAGGAATFAGRGRGHGVGLCQRGARGLAAAGWETERILAHYFPGARVAPLDR